MAKAKTVFKCECCNYVTDRSFDLDRHNLSKKHAEKNAVYIKVEKNEECKPEKKQYICAKCNKGFAFRQSLYKHKKDCNIDDVAINLNEELLKKDMIIKELQYQKVIDMKNMEIKHMKEKLDLYSSFKNIAENTAETSKSSCSALNYIIKHYNNAPCIQQFTKFELLTEGNEDYSIAEIAIHKYDNNELCTYIGDIIVAEYKTDDPRKQTMWTSDVNRLAYMIREVTVNNKVEWFNDKGGVKISKYIVQPILNHINDDLDRYYTEKLEDLDNDEVCESDKTVIRNKLVSVRNIAKIIKTNQLNDDIVKYMAKFMYLDRKNDVKAIEYNTNNELD